MCGKIPSMGVEATELVSSRADDVAHRAVELVLETRGFDHIAEIEAAISDAGWVMSA